LNGDNLVSVGASGAIMGLLAAGFIAAYRLPKEAGRTQVQGRLARILVPSLVPLAVSFEGKIDYSAHFGGAVTGSLLGLLLLATWPRQEPHPRLKEAATAVAGMGLAVLGYSVYAAASRYPALAEDAKLSAPLVLVADKDIPSDVAEAERTADIWGKDRPRDPRVHYYRALQLLRDHDPEGAKKELDIGLAEKGIFHKFFPNRMLETGMRTLLCAILIDADRKADAEVEAKPVCDAGEGGGPPERMTKLGLCGQSRK
jgi:rhomboid protease GluP